MGTNYRTRLPPPRDDKLREPSRVRRERALRVRLEHVLEVLRRGGDHAPDVLALRRRRRAVRRRGASAKRRQRLDDRPGVQPVETHERQAFVRRKRHAMRRRGQQPPRPPLHDVRDDDRERRRLRRARRVAPRPGEIFELQPGTRLVQQRERLEVRVLRDADGGYRSIFVA
eukprot:27124-Pelagococcus_subviridis.AAC.1